MLIVVTWGADGEATSLSFQVIETFKCAPAWELRSSAGVTLTDCKVMRGSHIEIEPVTSRTTAGIANPIGLSMKRHKSIPKVGRNGSELDDEVAREILRIDLAPFFAPQAQQCRLVVAHNDPGVRAADKLTPFVVE